MIQKTLNVSLRCTVSLLSTSYLSFCCQGTGNKTLKKRCFWLTNMFWCFSERYLFRCILNKTSKAVIHYIIKLQSIFFGEAYLDVAESKVRKSATKACYVYSTAFIIVIKSSDNKLNLKKGYFHTIFIDHTCFFLNISV